MFPNTEAFVSLPDENIYVVTSSAVFRDAQAFRFQCGSLAATKKLASVLIHEEWHLRHGRDERAAYEAQLTTLIRLGVAPDSGVYISVTRAMQVVLRKGNQKPEMVVASVGR